MLLAVMVSPQLSAGVHVTDNPKSILTNRTNSIRVIVLPPAALLNKGNLPSRY
jgi:hypothetical protein